MLPVGGLVHGGRGGSEDVLHTIMTGSPGMLPGVGVG